MASMPAIGRTSTAPRGFMLQLTRCGHRMRGLPGGDARTGNSRYPITVQPVRTQNVTGSIQGQRSLFPRVPQTINGQRVRSDDIRDHGCPYDIITGATLPPFEPTIQGFYSTVAQSLHERIRRFSRDKLFVLAHAPPCLTVSR